MTVMKFSKKAKPTASTQSTKKWKVMIVDDEIEVHTITQAVLKDFEFEGDGIEFINAYSGAEAMELIVKHEDIALIFLDPARV